MASDTYIRLFSGRCWGIGVLLLGLVLALLQPGAAARAQAPNPVICTGDNQLPMQGLMPSGSPQPDLLVTGTCFAKTGGAYYYGNVNILGGGDLDFEEPLTGNQDIAFWASSIIVEANGALKAGVGGTPYGGSRGGFLTIYLYGSDLSGGTDPAKNPGQGVLCKSKGAGPCGIPLDVWQNNGASVLPGCGTATVTPTSNCIPELPTAAKDYFYQYGPLYGDGKCTSGATFMVSGGEALCGSDPADGKVGYFGYKVLAVSYGGSLIMQGYKGASFGNSLPLNTGFSWGRLNGDLKPGDTSLTLDVPIAGLWRLLSDNDPARPHPIQMVVTTTDYLPGHSEVLTINKAESFDKLSFTPRISWFHNGTRYPVLSKLVAGGAVERLEKAGMDVNGFANGAETRAAVALLTRNIQIVSAGDVAGQTYAKAITAAQKAGTTYYFGAHTIFRQGFAQVQLGGVEFDNLGQGGKLGHYPVHFHMTRQVPPGTYVEDSSVNVSNTRWYVLHSTQGVTLRRNVGWESIGHGYYLEDGTEADNNFYSNIGIFARAAIDNTEYNPQKIPGILADNQDPASFIKINPANVPNPGFPFRSDNEYPTVFWITNGWNNFQGNMAAGAGACGAAYWFAPAGNTDMPDVPTTSNVYVEPGGPATTHMKWADGGVDNKNMANVRFGYAGLQRLPLWAGTTPLESFYGNYATSTMMSFQTTLDAPACAGFAAADAAKNNPPNVPFVAEIASFSPNPARHSVAGPPPHDEPDLVNDLYYPHVIGARFATRCPASTFAMGQYDCGPPQSGVPGTLATPCADGTPNLAAGQPPTDPNFPMRTCAPTVIDHFTSSFHWAQGDVSAIWLRPTWYLVTNSVISDVQQGGITFVTGGDVTRSSIITGYWGLVRDSILIGHTQPQDDPMHAYAFDIGPFNSSTMDKCEHVTDNTNGPFPLYCLNKAAGVSLPLTGFFNNQRLENIYDGPSYRDSNAYLDINTAGCPVGDFNTAIDTCIYGTQQTNGVLANPGGMPNCYLPNAAIAWKQPNGFFYPPAFHADNLYFSNVDIRHFVIDPLFKAFSDSKLPADFGQAGTYITDQDAVSAVYCLPLKGVDPKLYFNDYTSIDRQTELNDDDGTLTGLSNIDVSTLPSALKQTISVNEDDFFTAPVETPECASNIGKNAMPANACMSPSKAAPTVTAKTSPYDYVSTVIYHAEVAAGVWDSDCTNPRCYGVPLYRQFLAGNDTGLAATSTREWKYWHQNGCNTDQTPTKCRWPFIRMAGTAKLTRETLTVNNGTYYLDTTVPKAVQQMEKFNTQDKGQSNTTSFNVFQPNDTYYVFFVYAKPTTRQTYQIYLGKNATASAIKSIQVRLDNLNNITNLSNAPWLDPDTSQVGTSGIVSVKVDFGKLTDHTLDTDPANGLCQPLTFCKASGATCGSALTDSDPLVIANPNIKQQADAVCGQWAVKDLDCPPKGCYGFSFTIPSSGFDTTKTTVSNPSPYRPAPVAFPSDDKDQDQGKPTWLATFLVTPVAPDSIIGSQCHYETTKLPGTTCTVPDWVPQ